MTDKDWDKFAEFLALPEKDRWQFFITLKVPLWRKLEFWYLNKWWTSYREACPKQRPLALWISLYKGRF